MSNTYNITLVGVHYKIEDTTSGDAYYIPRGFTVLKSNGTDVIIDNMSDGPKGLKSYPYTLIQVGGVVQASAQATIDAIAALA